jgi:hypothetical protein
MQERAQSTVKNGGTKREPSAHKRARRQNPAFVPSPRNGIVSAEVQEKQ